MTAADSSITLTDHGKKRMYGRRFSESILSLVMAYGRTAYAHGAVIYAIGRKEVCRYKANGVDLHDLEGIQVVCGIDDGAVITVYRNRNLKKLRLH